MRAGPAAGHGPRVDEILTCILHDEELRGQVSSGPFHRAVASCHGVVRGCRRPQ
jgi:hypothetical protein